MILAHCDSDFNQQSLGSSATHTVLITSHWVIKVLEFLYTNECLELCGEQLMAWEQKCLTYRCKLHNSSIAPDVDTAEVCKCPR